MRFVAVILSVLVGGTVASAAAVVTVANPEIAPRTRTVNCEEVWRAGADDDADYLFGVIRDATTDEHGNIYLLDTQQQQVFKFSADGQYRGLVCRKGEGPGEIENTYNMRYLGGGRLGFMRMVPSAMVMVDTVGTPLPRLEFTIAHPVEEITFGGMYSCDGWNDMYYGQGRFYLADKSKASYLGFVASFDSAGQEIRRLSQWYGGYDFTRPIKVDELAEWHRAGLWDTDRAGHIFHTTARDSMWWKFGIRMAHWPDGCSVNGAATAGPGRRRTKPRKGTAFPAMPICHRSVTRWRILIRLSAVSGWLVMSCGSPARPRRVRRRWMASWLPTSLI